MSATPVRGFQGIRELGGVAGTLLLVGLVWAGLASGGEVRRLEAVGSVPVRSGGGATSPRDAAISEALQEAVSRVARELLIDVEVPADPDQDPDEAIVALLGGDMLQYTTRFRILEDRGERPALFADEPGVKAEYVVVVEVQVDIDRVRSQLVEAELLSEDGAAPEGQRVRVSVEGVNSYDAYSALRELLLEGSGADSVLPLEFERGRAVLAVESEQSPTALLEALRAHAPPNMGLEVVRTTRDSLELQLRFRPQVDSQGSPGDSERRGRTRGSSRN